MEGLNWSTGLYEHEIPVDIDEDTVVLIEGVLLYRPWLIPYFEYKIFLDINKTEILSRGEIRDVPRSGKWILNKYKTRYIPVHQCYLSEDRPLSDSLEYPFEKAR